MIGIRSILLAAALLGADAIVLRAQSPTEQPGDSLAMRQRFGLVGALGLNAHIADFTEIPGIPNCSPGFRSGFGLAPSIALLYERPLASRWMIQLVFRSISDAQRR